MTNLLQIAPLFVALGLAGFCPQSALAQPTSNAGSATTPPADFTDPLIAYKAYEDAIGADRLTEAALIGTKAWQLAEAKWGENDPNTGALAYNAAWISAIIDKPAARVDAARRAVELVDKAGGAYNREQAQFLLAYAEYFALTPNDRVAAATKLAAAALPVETTWSDFLIANALVETAKASATTAQGRETIRIAERALVAIDRVAPKDKDYRTLALFARAQGRLSANQDTEEAIADIVQARVAYGPMRSEDDKAWGTLAAWQVAIGAVEKTLNGFAPTTGTRLAPRTRRPLELTPEQLKAIDPSGSENSETSTLCSGVTRNNRIGPDILYPSEEINASRVAGVVIRYDLDSEGRINNARLLGAVPPGRFGDNTLKAVRTWQFKVPPGTPPECLKQRDIVVSFVLQ